MRTSGKGGISGELEMVEAIRQRTARAGPGPHGIRLGIGDDCAILRPAKGQEICITTDLSLEGVHFLREWHPAEAVGHRCLARGLSDLAAMGAEPLGVFLSLALPAGLKAQWVERFLDGFLALGKKHGVTLAGGDTAESRGPIVADIVAVGQVPQGRALLRSGARAGDGIYVTGALGGAAAELRALGANPQRFRGVRQAEEGHPHLYPEPRLAAGRQLRGAATAAIDVSDGLSTDLMHLCRESGLGATVEEAALPIHPLAARWKDGLELALDGGEDYELLFTAAAKVRVPRRMAGAPVHRIGTMRTAGRKGAVVVLKGREGTERRIEARGWEHFRAAKEQAGRKSD